MHRIWLCQGLDQNIKEIHEAQHLAQRASSECGDLACFWLRGIPPAPWLEVTPPPAGDSDIGLHIFELSEEVLASTIDLSQDDFAGASVYTDGSGGEDNAYPKLRRCAWGVAAVKAEIGKPTVFLGGWGQELTGVQQTVPRAELTAVLSVALRTRGNAIVGSDSKYVVDGFRQGKHLDRNDGDNVHGPVVPAWQGARRKAGDFLGKKK